MLNNPCFLNSFSRECKIATPVKDKLIKNKAIPKKSKILGARLMSLRVKTAVSANKEYLVDKY